MTLIWVVFMITTFNLHILIITEFISELLL